MRTHVAILDTLFVGAVAASLGACTPMSAISTGAESQPSPFAGAWAFVPDSGRKAPRDTVVWEFATGGGMRYATARGGRLRTSETGRWWVPTKGAKVAAAGQAPVVCARSLGARAYQCGRVQVDTVAGADGASRRRLTWHGTTFRQHWVFLERRAAP